MLGRDLQILQNLLTDFLSRGESPAFLNTYNVEADRISEIKDFLTDKFLTDLQLFWRDVLNAKLLSDTLKPFEGEETNYLLLASLLDIPIDQLKTLEAKIDFTDLNRTANLNPLAELFEALKMEVSRYNETAGSKIDFSAEYLRRFEGIKARYKKRFEQALYAHLLGRSPERQAGFQDTIDNYLSGFKADLPAHLLIFDIENYFHEWFAHAYPDLAITAGKNKGLSLTQGYSGHLETLTNLLKPKNSTLTRLEDFLSPGRYFDRKSVRLLAKLVGFIAFLPVNICQ